MSFNCGQSISTSCEGVTRTIDASGSSTYAQINLTWFSLVSEIITMATSLQNILIVIMSDSLTDNMKKGMNAIRCASISGLINIWMLLASMYYVARQFGQEAQIQTLLNEYWPYVCTCQQDVLSMQELFGSSSSNASFFTSCSD